MDPAHEHMDHEHTGRGLFGRDHRGHDLSRHPGPSGMGRLFRMGP